MTVLELRDNLTLSQANAFISQYHRHSPPVIGWKFGLAAYKDGKLVGVAIVGRPMNRYLQERGYLEITRVATDGTRNANSFLYAACTYRIFAMGYTKMCTYTLDAESGSSLKAVSDLGWHMAAKVRRQSGWGIWASRQTTVEAHEKYLRSQRIRWECVV